VPAREQDADRRPDEEAGELPVGDVPEAGRLAFKAGRIGKKLYATASSPLEGVPEWTS